MNMNMNMNMNCGVVSQLLRRSEVSQGARRRRNFSYIGLILHLLFWSHGAPAALKSERKVCFSNLRWVRCPDSATEEVIIASIRIENGKPVIQEILSQPGSWPRADQEVPDENDARAQLVDARGMVIVGAKLHFHHRIQVPPDQQGSLIDIYPASVELPNPEATLMLVRPQDAAKLRVELPAQAFRGNRGTAASQGLSLQWVEQDLPLPSLGWREDTGTPAQSATASSSSDGFFDVAILASGYDVSTMTSFDVIASQIMRRISSLQPFAKYNPRTRYYVIRNTQGLGCHSGCNGMSRLLCCDSAKVIAAAQEAGVSVDEIIVVDSTATYSGGGYRDLDRYQSDSLTSYSQVYGGPSAADMAVHEFGHSFANLCDEYSYSSEGYTYKSCVNCRPVCDDFGAHSSVCQISCDARPDYYRPENSIMYSLQYTTFNQVSQEESLQPRLEFFSQSRRPGITINDVSRPEGGEGASDFTFTVSLSEPSLENVSVSYSTNGGTAQAGADYFAVPLETLQFLPGEKKKVLKVSVHGDPLVEPDETFFVRLSQSVNSVILDYEGKGEILNDDYPSLKISSASLGEGNSASKPFQFTLSLNTASAKPVSVRYETVDASAGAGTDYIGLPLTAITFKPGETKKQVAVNVKGDTLRETNEIFYLRVSSPIGLTLFNTQGTGTILNDDGPVLRIDDASVVEGDEGPRNVTLKLSLTPASTHAVSLKYATTDGSAAAGKDYIGVPFTAITFKPGETTKTITVSVKPDRIKESDEAFFVNLSSANGATIFDRQGKVTVQNDD